MPHSPYSPPEQSGPKTPLHLVPRTSFAARVIAVIDFAVGAIVAAMIIDSPLYSVLSSLTVFLVTTVAAWGLFRTTAWGWWSAMILHNVILAAGTIVYVIVMFLLARDFGQTPNHMALITSEGAAVVLTILFAPTAVLAAVPVYLLSSRRCRCTYGVLSTRAETTQTTCNDNSAAV